jgi:hypothetical protein
MDHREHGRSMPWGIRRHAADLYRRYSQMDPMLLFLLEAALR